MTYDHTRHAFGVQDQIPGASRCLTPSSHLTTQIPAERFARNYPRANLSLYKAPGGRILIPLHESIARGARIGAVDFRGTLAGRLGVI